MVVVVVGLAFDQLEMKFVKAGLTRATAAAAVGDLEWLFHCNPGCTLRTDY